MSLRQFVVDCLTSRVAGRFIGWIFRQRIPHRGCIIDTSSPLVSPRVKARLFWRLYEHNEVGAVRRYLPPHLDVIELGASIGVLSCQVLRKQQSGRLIAVEANPALVPITERNIALNGFSDRATVLNAVVGREPGGFADFTVSDTTLSGRVGSPGEGVQVPVVSLASLLAEHQIENYALVSDIEGAEAGFMLGKPSALSGCRLLIIELHPSQVPPPGATVAELMSAAIQIHGFHLVETVPQGDCICCVYARRERSALPAP